MQQGKNKNDAGSRQRARRKGERTYIKVDRKQAVVRGQGGKVSSQINDQPHSAGSYSSRKASYKRGPTGKKSGCRAVRF